MTSKCRGTTCFSIALVAWIGAACNKESSGERKVVTEAKPTLPSQSDAAFANRFAITVEGQGYRPESVKAPPGERVQLVFTRTTDKTCGQELVFPSLNIRRDLPLNEPVTVELTMPASGSIAFTCGMDMFRGSVVVQ